MTMAMSKPTLLFFLFVQCFLPFSQAFTFAEFLALFVRPYRRIVVTRACNQLLKAYNDTYGLGCKCEGKFNESLGGRLVCQTDRQNCLVRKPVEIYCGDVDFVIDFTAVQGPTNFKGCLEIQGNIPEDLTAGDFPPVCAKAVPYGRNLTFKSCEITWGNEPCKSCEVCSSKRDFKFDCSNVDINPSNIPGDTVVEGPTIQSCQGLGFLDPF
jgi:hypothetical protein